MSETKTPRTTKVDIDVVEKPWSIAYGEMFCHALTLETELTAVRGELESETAWAHEYHSNQVQLEKQIETLKKELDEARADLKLNAGMLARQMDMARQAENERDALQKAVGEAYHILDDHPYAFPAAADILKPFVSGLDAKRPSLDAKNPEQKKGA